ncbi:hypothetical protein CC86DRAFT_367787 [Ophiobolus disseminans]|uniref:VWFD domain-containing protein n=1 Tax=Ophiobolus disseminans TaxID=1469910 RepID=A0A6A7AAY0_9PLEO|nr:hypothetical protein CC86DRAFT_367787 [Ophiobolus disseminans]
MMWKFALLAPFLAAASPASPGDEKNNSTSIAFSSISISTLSAQSTSSLVVPNVYGTTDISSSFSSPRSLSSRSLSRPSSPLLAVTSQTSSSFVKISERSSSEPTSSPPLTTVTLTTSTPSPSSTSLTSPNHGSSTRLPSSSRSSSSNATTSTLCTGCIIQARNPITTFFDKEDIYNRWTSLVVTATVVTSVITYNDTVVTQSRTVNQTKTLVLTDEDTTITHQTPTFHITPANGVVLTLNAGPTYVIWKDIYGGLDRLASGPAASCGATPTQLKNWQPTREEDWNYFIQTYSRNSTAPKNTNTAIPVPSEALQYLKNNLAIHSVFQGSDIATCTFHQTTTVWKTQPALTIVPHPSPALPEPAFTTQRPGAPPPQPPRRSSPAAFPTSVAAYPSAITSTFLSTTYATTVTHVTRAGCLRCQDTVSPPSPTPDDRIHNEPEPTPSNPDNNTNNPSKPEDSPRPNEQRPPNVPVVIGDSTYTVNPARQTSQSDRPSEQYQAPPAIIIGTQILTPGQSTTINGVPVIVPLPTPGDGGPRIVVNGNTINIPTYSSPTGPPIMTIGSNTITANSEGQFLVGTQTLKPGGSAITMAGSTLSLASNGGILVVNGVTRTLQNAPIMTPAPVITVGGRVVSATVIGSNTQFVVGTQTLVPGNAITVDGVTYSLPSGGGKIVVNGVTSSLNSGRGSITIGQQYVTASIKDGTTSYVFAAGQTLTPGGVLTVSGTTFSMPASASGSVVVINGVTSTLRPGSLTTPLALTLNGKTYAATVRSGTTEFVLASGVTLRPGQAVTMSGTTYSLDGQGTALVINGQTSSIRRGPASNNATTTPTSSARSTTVARDVGNFVWSGIGGGGGGSSSTGGGIPAHLGGLDKWVEGIVIGIAGWLLLL